MAKTEVVPLDSLRVMFNRLSLRLSRPVPGGQAECQRLEAELDAMRAALYAVTEKGSKS